MADSDGGATRAGNARSGEAGHCEHNPRPIVDRPRGHSVNASRAGERDERRSAAEFTGTRRRPPANACGLARACRRARPSCPAPRSRGRASDRHSLRGVEERRRGANRTTRSPTGASCLRVRRGSVERAYTDRAFRSCFPDAASTSPLPRAPASHQSSNAGCRTRARSLPLRRRRRQRESG